MSTFKPWTLNVEGKSKYFDTKEEAIDFLSKNYSKKRILISGVCKWVQSFMLKNLKI